MKKKILIQALRSVTLMVSAICSTLSVCAEGRGPFILPGELDFLAIRDLEIKTVSLLNEEYPVDWTGEGYHTGLQQVSFTIYNCKEIPASFTVPKPSMLIFSIVNGYGEVVASVENDMAATFTKIKYTQGNFQSKISESIAVMRGGSYTLRVSISPDLFSYDVVANLKDEAGVRAYNTKANLGSDLAPVVTISSGFPYKPESVAGEKTLHWTVARTDDPSNILDEDTETFKLETDSILLAAETALVLPVSGLQPGEYIYTLTSDYAPACQSFKAYVYDVLDADITLDKRLYTVGEDKEAILDIDLKYGYPYIFVNTETKLPTINVVTELLDQSETTQYTDAAWENAPLNYVAKVSVPLDKITDEVVKEYKGEVPLTVIVSFNNQIQYKGLVNLPFKYDNSGIEDITIDSPSNVDIKFYNVFGVEVDNSYRGLVITSDGRKILK